MMMKGYALALLGAPELLDGNLGLLALLLSLVDEAIGALADLSLQVVLLRDVNPRLRGHQQRFHRHLHDDVR